MVPTCLELWVLYVTYAISTKTLDENSLEFIFSSSFSSLFVFLFLISFF